MKKICISIMQATRGFSGTDASWELAGTALWKDVLSLHRRTPIHCMVGGGDQLYQDGFFAVSIYDLPCHLVYIYQ